MSKGLAFTVPLPPAALRSNSRAFWAVRVKAKQEYSEIVLAAAGEHLTFWHSASHAVTAGKPVKAAKVTYTWRYCGNAPDKANLGQNLKALQDFLCLAPNNGMQVNNCFYLGIVADDRGIDPIFKLEHVAHRSEQCVLVEIVPTEEVE